MIKTTIRNQTQSQSHKHFRIAKYLALGVQSLSKHYQINYGDAPTWSEDTANIFMLNLEINIEAILENSGMVINPLAKSQGISKTILEMWTLLILKTISETGTTTDKFSEPVKAKIISEWIESINIFLTEGHKVIF
jgi:hypothetical protein